MISVSETFEEQVQTAFFDAEVDMEKDKCRDMVSLDPEAERRKILYQRTNIEIFVSFVNGKILSNLQVLYDLLYYHSSWNKA